MDLKRAAGWKEPLQTWFLECHFFSHTLIPGTKVHDAQIDRSAKSCLSFGGGTCRKKKKEDLKIGASLNANIYIEDVDIVEAVNSSKRTKAHMRTSHPLQTALI